MKRSAAQRDDTKRIEVIKSQAHREKISQILKGRKVEGVAREKLMKRLKSPEYIKHMSVLNSIRQRSSKEIKAVSVARNGGAEFTFYRASVVARPISMRAFCLEYKLDRKKLRELTKGCVASYKGWTCSVYFP